MLEEFYDSESDIPAGYKSLYKEVDGKWKILPGGEIKTVADTTALQTALSKQRNETTEAKQQLAKFSELGDLDDVQAKLDKIPELEAAAAGNLDEEKINGIVEGRLNAAKAPLDRKIKQLTDQNTELAGQVTEFEQRETERKITDAITEAATAAKVRPEAMEDAKRFGLAVLTVDETGAVVTKDNAGVIPFVDAATLIAERKESSPHWFPESQGAGARSGGGSAGSNPYKTGNLTEIGKLRLENPERANQMAAAAGCDPVTGVALPKAG